MYFQFPFWGSSLSKDNNMLKWILEEQNFGKTFSETYKTDYFKALKFRGLKF